MVSLLANYLTADAAAVTERKLHFHIWFYRASRDQSVQKATVSLV